MGLLRPRYPASCDAAAAGRLKWAALTRGAAKATHAARRPVRLEAQDTSLSRW